jgi:malonyl-CoA O-methyltransferase
MNRVAHRFDRAVNTYDAHAEMQDALGETLLGLYRRERQPRRILELGCGTGLFSRKLWQRFPSAQFCITDAAPRMVAAAEAKWTAEGKTESASPRFFVLDATEVAWPRGEAETKNLADIPFDLIASNALVQWFQGAQGLARHLRGAALILRSGGDLLLSGFGAENLVELRLALQRMGKSSGSVIGHDAETVQKVVEDEGLVLKSWHATEARKVYASPQDLLRHLAALGATGGANGNQAHLLRSDFKKLEAIYHQHYLAPGGGVTATWSTWAAWLIKP